MLAQLVERALSMCKVRSSTLLHSTIFFCCCGVGGVLRGAKNNKQHRVFDSKEEDKYMMSSNAKEVREAFFLRTNSFSYAKSPFYNCYNTTTSYVLLLCTIRVYFHLLLLLLVLFTLYYYISLALYCSMFQLLKNAGTPNAKSVGSFST